MSSLIFYTQPYGAFVVTDTLAVGQDDRSDKFFTTKAHYLPHLRMIIAGTGYAGFADRWYCHVNSQMRVAGIENLDYHTPSSLKQAWEGFCSRENPPPGTTTVYHIGFSEETGEVVTFAYRSKNDFSSERIPYGLACKPDCSVPDGDDLTALIRPMMEEQREIQSKIPADERIYIGGEANAIRLTPDGCRQWTLFRFADF